MASDSCRIHWTLSYKASPSRFGFGFVCSNFVYSLSLCSMPKGRFADAIADADFDLMAAFDKIVAEPSSESETLFVPLMDAHDVDVDESVPPESAAAQPSVSPESAPIVMPLAKKRPGSAPIVMPLANVARPMSPDPAAAAIVMPSAKVARPMSPDPVVAKPIVPPESPLSPRIAMSKSAAFCQPVVSRESAVTQPSVSPRSAVAQPIVSPDSTVAQPVASPDSGCQICGRDCETMPYSCPTYPSHGVYNDVGGRERPLPGAKP